MTRQLEHLWPGVPLALASAVLFGLSTPFAKWLLGGTSPGLLAGLLYAGSGLGLLLTLAVRRQTGEVTEASLRREEMGWLGAVVLSGGVLGPLLLMYGLAGTPASVASLLLNLEGVFTLGIAWIVFRENVDYRIAAGAGAILLGAALLSWSSGSIALNWRGLAIVAACLAWAIDNNLTRKLSGADPVQLAAIKGVCAGSVNIALAAAVGAVWPGAVMIAMTTAVGFLGYGLSLVCFILALRHLGAARTGAYFSLAPFVGATCSILAFGDPVTTRFAIAAALMGFGLFLHLAERHEHTHAHEAMTHEHRHVHDEHHRHAHGPDDPAGEPHSHRHTHTALVHAHRHYPDLHHRHEH